MYAVIRTGGKQYKVSPGDRIRVEKLGAPAAEVTLEPLLVVDGDRVTTDAGSLSAFPVVARVVDNGRGKKIKAGKYKSKSRYYRRWGHRQDYSEIEIHSIGNHTAPAPVEPAAAEAEPEHDTAIEAEIEAEELIEDEEIAEAEVAESDDDGSTEDEEEEA